MGVILRFVTIILIVFNISCFILKDKKLRLVRQDYNGTEIQLNGYYLGVLSGINKGMNSIYFFYRDGVVLYGGGFAESDDIGEKEVRFRSKEFNEGIKKYKSGWGVFAITGNEIEFETWEPSNGGPLHSVNRSGKIINNRTFVITSFYNGYDKKISIMNDTFYFKEFSPKPDSTNRFIK